MRRVSEAGTKRGASTALVVIGAVLAICLLAVVAVGVVGYVGFRRFVEQSEASEAAFQLRSIYRSAAAYYVDERYVSGHVATACTVDPAVTSNPPGPTATRLSSVPPSFADLGWAPAEPVRYRYAIEGPPGRCGNVAGTELYTLRAHGDLDGDGVLGERWLVVRANHDNELGHDPVETRDDTE